MRDQAHFEGGFATAEECWLYTKSVGAGLLANAFNRDISGD